MLGISWHAERALPPESSGRIGPHTLDDEGATDLGRKSSKVPGAHICADFAVATVTEAALACQGFFWGCSAAALWQPVLSVGLAHHGSPHISWLRGLEGSSHSLASGRGGNVKGSFSRLQAADAWCTRQHQSSSKLVGGGSSEGSRCQGTWHTSAYLAIGYWKVIKDELVREDQAAPFLSRTAISVSPQVKHHQLMPVEHASSPGQAPLSWQPRSLPESVCADPGRRMTCRSRPSEPAGPKSPQSPTSRKQQSPRAHHPVSKSHVGIRVAAAWASRHRRTPL